MFLYLVFGTGNVKCLCFLARRRKNCRKFTPFLAKTISRFQNMLANKNGKYEITSYWCVLHIMVIILISSNYDDRGLMPLCLNYSQLTLFEVRTRLWLNWIKSNHHTIMVFIVMSLTKRVMHGKYIRRTWGSTSYIFSWIVFVTVTKYSFSS